MKSAIVILISFLSVFSVEGAPKPGVFYAFPAPSSETKVVRDFLGNQATSYAYQDGHSSAVSLSRNDVSKHLVAAPVPVAVAEPIYYGNHPVSYDDHHHHHEAIPAVYNYNAYPAYYHSAPTAYSSPYFY